MHPMPEFLSIPAVLEWETDVFDILAGSEKRRQKAPTYNSSST